MTCSMRSPGECPACSRRVRWADIQACRHGQPASIAPARSCGDCAHRGQPLLAANGRQVGSEGCGCTAASKSRGLLWWACTQAGQPVRQDRASQCEAYLKQS